MKKILNGNIRLLDISFLALVCYPLLKFNYSSLILIIFCVLAFISSIRSKEFYFTKTNFKRFAILSLFFFLLLVSVIYSENTSKAINRITQLLPLILIPFVILFFKPKFSQEIRIKALNLFLITNGVYLLILTGVCFANFNYGGGVLDDAGFFPSYDKIQFILNEVITGDILFVHKAYFSMGFVLISIVSLQRANSYFLENRRKSIGYFLAFLVFTFVVVFAFSFPNIIALVGCIILFIIYEFRNGTLKIQKLLLPFVIAIGLGVIGIFFTSDDLDIKRGISFINSVLFQKNSEGNDPRIEIYRTYSSLVEKATPKEFILGFGVGDEQDLIHEETGNRIQANRNKNMLKYTEELDNSNWFRTNVKVASNQISAPNGNRTADQLIGIESGQKESHNLSTNVVLEEGAVYTLSVYAKAKSADKLVLRLGSMENRAYFDLKDGKLIGKYEGILKASVTPEKDLWFRCAVSIKGTGNALAIIGILSSEGTYNYTGSANDLYVWGAQLERRRSVSNYVKNTNELMEYVYYENLNTHNTYLFFLMTGGILCLLAFLGSLFFLFRESFKNKSVLQASFMIIIVLNFLTENLFSRHWGLMFVSVMAIVLFTPTNSKTNVEKSI